MSVIVDRDCVVLGNGSLLCWDGDDECCYLLDKRKVSPSEIAPNDIQRLLMKVSASSRPAFLPITQSDLDMLEAFKGQGG